MFFTVPMKRLQQKWQSEYQKDRQMPPQKHGSKSEQQHQQYKYLG